MKMFPHVQMTKIVFNNEHDQCLKAKHSFLKDLNIEKKFLLTKIKI